MARLFVSLKLRLIAGVLSGPGGGARLVGLIIAIAGALCIMPVGFVLLAAQHGKPDAASVAVVVFTAFALGWLVFPVATFGTDETLDPARLALLPLRPAQLARGLFAAALTGIGPLVTTVILFGAVAAVATSPAAALVGIAAVAIEVGLCVAGSRALVTALSGMLRSRRGRDLGVVVSGLIVLLIFAVNLAIQASVLGGPRSGAGLAVGGTMRSVAAVARLAPPGLTAHAIADASAGRYPVAAAELGAGAATVLLLVWAWTAALHRVLENPDASTQQASRGGRQAAAAGATVARSSRLAWMSGPARRWAGRAWQSRALTTAGRELRYYRRDPRRKRQLVSLAMPVLWILLGAGAFAGSGLGGPGGAARVGGAAGVAGSAAGAGLSAWPAIGAGLFAGLFSSANQFGIDGSAAWIPFAATSRWQDLRDDLAGKSLAGAVLTVPVFGLLYLVLGAVRQDGRGAAIAFALAICACGASSAVATVISVLLPVPVPERRSSAFGGGGAGQGCLAAVATFAGLGVALALMTPVFVAWAMLHSGAWLVVAGPAYGAAAAWAGRLVAARVGFRRLPEMLAVVSRAI